MQQPTKFNEVEGHILQYNLPKYSLALKKLLIPAVFISSEIFFVFFFKKIRLFFIDVLLIF